MSIISSFFRHVVLCDRRELARGLSVERNKPMDTMEYSMRLTIQTAASSFMRLTTFLYGKKISFREEQHGYISFDCPVGSSFFPARVMLEKDGSVTLHVPHNAYAGSEEAWDRLARDMHAYLQKVAAAS